MIYSYSDLLGNHQNPIELLKELNLNIDTDIYKLQDKMIEEYKKIGNYYKDHKNEILEKLETINDDFNVNREYYNALAESEIRDIFYKCAIELLNDCKNKINN